MDFLLVAPLLWIGLAAVPTDRTAVLYGTVSDSLSGRPVFQASVRLAHSDRADLTDANGRFLLLNVEPGRWQIVIRHVSHETRVTSFRAPPGSDSIRVDFLLRPRVYQADELVVNADRVLPSTSGKETRYALSRQIVTELGLDDPIEIAGRLPGVVLLGPRAFFRGTSFEHVLPLLDGIPTRDPMRGDWITPPPDALQLMEFTPSAFDAQYGQALGGVFSLELPESSARHRIRIGAETERIPVSAAGGRETDVVRITAEGPLPGRGLSYTASWQGRVDDGALSYDRHRPTQRLLGASAGDRMQGDATGIARIAWRAPGAGRRHTLTYLGTEVRRKTYHHHYSRRGWVGWNPEYDRYTTFVDPAVVAGSVSYDAAGHVPTRTRTSHLLQQTNELRLGKSADLSISFRGAEHRHLSRAEGLAFRRDDEVVEWIRDRTTRLEHQEEPFFATHGDYPEYEDGRSRELAGVVSLTSRSGGHEISAGSGITVGRHRFLAARPLVRWTPYGSLRHWESVLEEFAYLQDTWWSDVHSSMTLALRWDARKVRGYLGDARISTLSPRIGFRQPFSDRDAIHVQYGVLTQFPPLIEHFLRAATLELNEVEWRAQTSRAFEMGVQHHLSEHAVIYATVFRREYSDLVFAAREASEEDALFPGAVSRPATITSESQGLELLLDHRFHHALSGQLQAEIGSQSAEGVDAPWGRAAAASGWLTAHPVPDLSMTLFGRWDAGQPYSVCLDPKGCGTGGGFRGTLPDFFELEFAGRWTPDRRTKRLHVNVEIRNLLNRRIPTFNFGIYSSSVGVGNFLAYYDRYGRPGGYLQGSGSTYWATHIRNPETLTEERTVRVGLQVDG